MNVSKQIKIDLRPYIEAERADVKEEAAGRRGGAGGGTGRVGLSSTPLSLQWSACRPRRHRYGQLTNKPFKRA